MNFDDALKHYLPHVWFRFKFLKYKYFKRGEPELWLIRHLIEPGTTAVDVGASIGMYAAEMARHAGKVLAFEANPEVATFARSVATRNVEVINMALSSRAGRTTLTVPLNARGRAVTELASIAPKQLSGENVVTVDVETRRLDDFPISNCGFIKIDVEGHEEAVLDGGANPANPLPTRSTGPRPSSAQKRSTRSASAGRDMSWSAGTRVRPWAGRSRAMHRRSPASPSMTFRHSQLDRNTPWMKTATGPSPTST